eukprot:gene1733-33143_t
MGGGWRTGATAAVVREYVEGETLQVLLEKVGGIVIEGLARFLFQQLILAVDYCHRWVMAYGRWLEDKGTRAVVSQHAGALQAFPGKVEAREVEALGRFLFQQLILAVDYCHRMKKVLRDIKLSTVLLSISPGQLPLLKLCDFSVSKDTVRDAAPRSQAVKYNTHTAVFMSFYFSVSKDTVQDAAPRSQVGSALFAAPEVMQNFSNMEYNGGAADIWSCGIILAIMLFGRHPFLRPEDVVLDEQQQVMMLFQRVISNDLSFPPELLGHLTPECKDLISNLLKRFPAQQLGHLTPECKDLTSNLLKQLGHLTPEFKNLISNLLKVDPKQRAPIAKIMQHPWFQVDLPKGAANMNLAFQKPKSNAS